MLKKLPYKMIRDKTLPFILLTTTVFIAGKNIRNLCSPRNTVKIIFAKNLKSD